MAHSARPIGWTVAGMAVALAVSQPHAAETWNLANEYGATTIHAEGNTVFADKVAEASGGELEIVVHPGGALGYKSADHFDAVSDGAVEIADTPANFLGGVDPIMLLSSLPFLAQTVDQAHTLMEIAMPYYEPVFEDAGQKILYASPWPASGIWAKQAIASVDDLAGLKIRTYDPNGTNTLKELGAAPIQLAWGDVVPQLATGGIDAVLTSAEGGVSLSFWEHTPFFTEINYAVPLNVVHVNADSFDALSPELQEAVTSAAAAASERNWAEVRERVQRNYGLIREAGATVVEDASGAFLGDLGKAGQLVLDEWLAKTGEDGQAIIDAYRAKIGG